MAVIVIADNGIEFDGCTPNKKPLGGAESSVIALSEALASLGHDVTVYNMCRASLDYKGVKWRSIKGTLPEVADLYIANRGDKLLNFVRRAKKVIFWCHNPANYMLKWRYLSKLWFRRPVVVFIGEYHATTFPKWAPDGGRKIIPYGISSIFCDARVSSVAPPPRAIFVSNPLRGLDWLLERWAIDIQPNVQGAELHIFSGSATYGSVGSRKANQMELVLNRARELSNRAVFLRNPVSKEQLLGEFSKARCLLYRGDHNETFCLAVGEAQAMGVPCVVKKLGSMPERVIHGKTGFVVTEDTVFSKSAKQLLVDDKLWCAQHEFALKKQRNWRWRNAAKAFEGIMHL